MYAAYRSVIDRYQAQHKLAELDYQPDFKVGLSCSLREPNRVDSGIDFSGFEVGINLPTFWDKHPASGVEAKEGERLALARYNDFRNQVLHNIQDAYCQVQTSQQEITRCQKSIPQARHSLESAMKGYHAGKISSLSLLDRLMTLYNLELQYEKAVSDGRCSLARLEAESGQAL
jgi:outer membrane protein TolC